MVGNEILDGVTLDTNTQWMINQLKPLNYHVIETLTVRDDTTEIAKALNRMIEDRLGQKEDRWTAPRWLLSLCCWQLRCFAVCLP